MLVFCSCFLDTVVKPRYDTERIFQAMQQCLWSLVMTN
ncbi:MAG TPA: palindromic element RPE4 domain-containing protein [Rickettsia endosymbiont of Ceroptres masudai]|nr:palindromic element RPE4 domain-containing protein [Rickettsia endosymbiont of Ceroptres masudai]